MPDCAQQLIDIGICEQESEDLYDQWSDKDLECMSRWEVYWIECGQAVAAGEPTPDAGDPNEKCAQKAKRHIEWLRKMGYEIVPVKAE